MPSLNASPVRSAERCSTTCSSSARITSGAPSTSTSASTTKRVRTKPSGTSSRFDVQSRQTDVSTQSPYSVDSITTIGVSHDGTSGDLPVWTDDVCSQHGYLHERLVRFEITAFHGDRIVAITRAVLASIVQLRPDFDQWPGVISDR